MAGSSTVTKSDITVNGRITRKVLTIAWTGAAAGGAIDAITINPVTYGLEGWFLYSVETNPGTTAPTDNYDIAITDADGFDIAGGLLADRDQTNTEMVNLRVAAAGYPMVRGNLSVAITNNSVNSATGTIILAFVK